MKKLMLATALGFLRARLTTQRFLWRGSKPSTPDGWCAVSLPTRAGVQVGNAPPGADTCKWAFLMKGSPCRGVASIATCDVW